ncbi:CubicO group peptidase (beta-lactamase class C family) [Bradyrhizobium sp. GM24.11]
MDTWLRSAIDYIGSWIEFQQTTFQQPGVMVAFVHRGKVVAEHAFGLANLDTGEKLTPRHRFRIASHSKSFTAAGIMKLREQRKLRLDDPVGQYVGGLHPRVAETTIAQVLSHSAGLTRDGADSGQFIDSRPYLNARELLAGLKLPPAIEPGTRFKYSNHGFALMGLVIEAVTKEPYSAWIKHEIVEPAGLRETEPNAPLPRGALFARGHTRKLPLGERCVIPGDHPAHAMASAAGFVATAADTARFFAQLAPNARKSVLSVASRREMTHNHWRVPQAMEGYYGLGVNAGKTDGWDWFGPWRRLPGLHLPDLLHPRMRTRDQHPQQLHRWRCTVLDGWRNADPARLQEPRRTRPACARLDRPLVDDLGRERSGARRQPRARRQSAVQQSVHGCRRDRGHRPRHRQARLGGRSFQPWRAGAPRP